DRARQSRVARIETRVAQREVGGEALLERPRMGHRLHDRARRGDAGGHAGWRRLGRGGAPAVVSALPPSQPRLASNHRRPPRLDPIREFCGWLASGFRAGSREQLPACREFCRELFRFRLKSSKPAPNRLMNPSACTKFPKQSSREFFRSSREFFLPPT